VHPDDCTKRGYNPHVHDGISFDPAFDRGRQGFFLRAFEKDFFAGFDPSRARFRTEGARARSGGPVSNRSGTRC
jgi:hypothetical protein